MSRYTTDANWRDAARPAKFFGIDAKAAMPLLLFLLHMRLWTLLMTIGFTFFFGILSHFGFTFRVFIVRFRCFLAGRHKLAKPWWNQ